VNAALGTLAKPGATRSLSINVCSPAWLRGETPPCWDKDPELFFPYKYNLTYEDQIQEARAVCQACPVRLRCLEWALERPDLEGIWAATTPMERRRIRTGKGAAA